VTDDREPLADLASGDSDDSSWCSHLPHLTSCRQRPLFGAITAPVGAAIPKAKVKIALPDTGFVRTVVTNDSGSYRADFLPIGSYEATGFKTLGRGYVRLTGTDSHGHGRDGLYAPRPEPVPQKNGRAAV
jgi:hypothetical protein